jgi:hypothetical protein
VNHILHRCFPPARPAAVIAFPWIAAASLVIAVTACGSSSPQSSHASSAVLGSAQQQDCTAVADVLADGPDPDADPVGYAQAQVLPLRQLVIGDAALHRDVLALATAYQAYSTAYQAYSTASSADRAAASAKVTTAAKVINSICPGATS